jgi:hypothetical protein
MAAVCGIVRYCGRDFDKGANEQFTLSNCTETYENHPRWSMRPLLSEEQSRIRAILNQKFSYLGQGHQAYVFASEDGQYVLKFLKYERLHPSHFVERLITWIPQAEPYLRKTIGNRAGRLEANLKSWKLAFDELADETGVLYAQINASDGWLPNTTVVDERGMGYAINMNQTLFLLQKRADLYFPRLEVAVCRHDTATAMKMIDELLAWLNAEYERGVCDEDRYVLQNTGFFEGKLVHIDVGRLVKAPYLRDDPQERAHRLWNNTRELRWFLQEHDESLARYLEERLSLAPNYVAPHNRANQ